MAMKSVALPSNIIAFPSARVKPARAVEGHSPVEAEIHQFPHLRDHTELEAEAFEVFARIFSEARRHDGSQLGTAEARRRASAVIERVREVRRIGQL